MMFSSRSISVDDLNPIMALIISEAGEHVTVTRHGVSDDGKSLALGAGSAVSLRDVEQLCSVLKNVRNESSFKLFDRHILAQSSTAIAWVMPAGQRDMWFSSGSKKVRLNVPWPDLVCCATDNKLSVAAIKTKRLNENTPLYHAPLMNTSGDAEICLGAATIPSGGALPSELPKWEKILTDTYFSHTNNENTMQVEGENSCSNKDHLSFWKQLHATKARKFPNSVMTPLNMRLGQFLASTGR